MVAWTLLSHTYSRRLFKVETAFRFRKPYICFIIIYLTLWTLMAASQTSQKSSQTTTSRKRRRSPLETPRKTGAIESKMLWKFPEPPHILPRRYMVSVCVRSPPAHLWQFKRPNSQLRYQPWTRLSKRYVQQRCNLHSSDQYLDVVWPETKQIGIIDSIFRNFYVPPVIFGKFYDLIGSQ